jgi:hypothetical protein
VPVISLSPEQAALPSTTPTTGSTMRHRLRWRGLPHDMLRAECETCGIGDSDYWGRSVSSGHTTDELISLEDQHNEAIREAAEAARRIQGITSRTVRP